MAERDLGSGEGRGSELEAGLLCYRGSRLIRGLSRTEKEGQTLVSIFLPRGGNQRNRGE